MKRWKSENAWLDGRNAANSVQIRGWASEMLQITCKTEGPRHSSGHPYHGGGPSTRNTVPYVSADHVDSKGERVREDIIAGLLFWLSWWKTVSLLAVWLAPGCSVLQGQGVWRLQHGPSSAAVPSGKTNQASWKLAE